MNLSQQLSRSLFLDICVFVFVFVEPIGIPSSSLSLDDGTFLSFSLVVLGRKWFKKRAHRESTLQPLSTFQETKAFDGVTKRDLASIKLSYMIDMLVSDPL